MRCGAGADIRQTADVDGSHASDDGQVEIRIVLDKVEPLAGHVRVLPDPGRPAGAQANGAGHGQIRFAGWLGLLRALYEVTAGSGDLGPPGA